ncbi:MAG: hypothetical protein AVDCRST_MAG37-3683 [uncultured Rubrobacteraceae bacterium]|uniref:Cupin type-2 domain-containing protein n=1 Tax=uncultured Rubrobacteraceae bacterium TaxID=349277 RepID=A0A6J4R8F4_9ACTN|nr:MAG: hypothetical protein AVDCRST_MAG37-3683 [uncultured Rubrobacteraceae bacterium]
MVGTDMITFKTTTKTNGGTYALFESLVLPDSGPPPHIHHREAESFYVLEGEFEVLDRDRWIKADAGSFVRVPKETLHTLRTREERSVDS